MTAYEWRGGITSRESLPDLKQAQCHEELGRDKGGRGGPIKRSSRWKQEAVTAAERRLQLSARGGITPLDGVVTAVSLDPASPAHAERERE